jgi:hypothetical protein
MKRIVVLLAIASSAPAWQEANVTYLATQASVQDAVRTIASQAGLGYDWQKSFRQTDPQCRRWVRDVRIEAVPFETAVRQILGPVGLRYEVESGRVVLYPDPNASPLDSLPKEAPPQAEPPPGFESAPVTYSVDRKSVQYVVIDLARAVGLGYNWNKSFSQTDPECRRWVDGLSIRNQPFDKAMRRVLDPVGLRYQVEGTQVVLYRK